MTSVPSVADAVVELASKFSGQLLQPADAGYDEARKVHNGIVNKRPVLIARCRAVADVVDAVNLARKLSLEMAVCGGGHNVAGRATVDNGLMIDLSLMKGIHVDPVQRTVRAQGGATWGDFNPETQLYGLATTGGTVSTTGIAGLTLGGGLGWLMGKHGLAADNLISAEVVTAEGQVVRASAAENADLFWALRGGGGNFGVVSWFEYRLHPVGPVTSGLVAHPIKRAREVLQLYRELTSAGPDELSLHALLHTPDASPRATILACHCGSLAEGEAGTRRLGQFGSPVLGAIGPASYVDTNTTMYDAAFPRGARNYWKSSFLVELSDAVIDELVARFALCPSPMSGLLLEHLHGAAARVGVGETAFPHRRESYSVLAVSQWLDAKDDEKNIAWARDTYVAMQPFVGSGRYVNYLDDDEPGDPAAAAYGPNYRRLREIKAKYDPYNFFHMNQNIRPIS
jgi:FAD/FMN-containing dehydrogenase